MPGHQLAPFLSRGLARGLASSFALAPAALLASLSGGCDADHAEASSVEATHIVDILSTSQIDGYELLLVVDDSASMADRRPTMAHAAAEMVRRLIQPTCVDDLGVPVEPQVRIDDDGRCPDGARPERESVRDLHVGVITTSLGAAGHPCAADGDGIVETGDGRALLVRRTASGDAVPTWRDRGFLAWDPEQIQACDVVTGDGRCPGLSSADELIGRVEDIVGGVGVAGCGQASALEAAWRFLGDPEPALGVDEDGVPFGVDAELLEQRYAFLHPGASGLIVAILSDEDDTSLRNDGIGAYFADAASPMPRARAECALDPESPCCASCIEPTPDGCSGDGACAAPGCNDVASCPGNYYPAGSPEAGDAAHRCVDGKRRFGVDPCYPVERYVNAMTMARIDLARIDLGGADDPAVVLNPLTDHQIELVTIVDLPWETIARRNAQGEPDLVHGLDPEGAPRGGYQSVAELVESGAWESRLSLPSTSPRRLLDLASRVGARAQVASLAPPRFEPAGSVRGLDVGFDAALRGFELGRPVVDYMACFDRTLLTDDAGGVSCHVIEARDSDGDGDADTTRACDCAAAGSRIEPTGNAEALADAARSLAEGRLSGSGFDCFCAIPQLAGAFDDPTSPRHHCQFEDAGPSGVDGWCYVEPQRGLGSADWLSCGAGVHTTGFRFVGEGAVAHGATAIIGCFAPEEE